MALHHGGGVLGHPAAFERVAEDRADDHQHLLRGTRPRVIPVPRSTGRPRRRLHSPSRVRSSHAGSRRRLRVCRRAACCVRAGELCRPRAPGVSRRADGCGQDGARSQPIPGGREQLVRRGLVVIEERATGLGRASTVSLAVRPRLAGVTLALALASAAEIAILYHRRSTPRGSTTAQTPAPWSTRWRRACTRWPSRPLTRRVTRGARAILDGLGTTGLCAIGLLIWRTNEYSAFPYRRDRAAVRGHRPCSGRGDPPRHPAGPMLGWGPLRWLGVRS